MPYVLSCLTYSGALHALVSLVLRALHVVIPRVLRALMPHVLRVLHAVGSHVLRALLLALVLSCSTCSRASRASCPTCFLVSLALYLTVPMSLVPHLFQICHSNHALMHLRSRNSCVSCHLWFRYFSYLRVLPVWSTVYHHDMQLILEESYCNGFFST